MSHASKPEKRKPEENGTADRDQKRQCSNNHTVAVALPASIMENAQSQELTAYLVGQIARACTIFCIDEIIIFNDRRKTEKMSYEHTAETCTKMARLLQYIECPQYLRKHFFPLHPDLKNAGLINPLDAPHHMRRGEQCKYREGVVRNDGLVNVGLGEKLVRLPNHTVIEPGTRVTVELASAKRHARFINGTAVNNTKPCDDGIYWGYKVRVCENLHEVFTKCPYPDMYDLTLGTSERGTVVDNVSFPDYKHCLIVFGGLQGLEAALEADAEMDIDDPCYLFHHYLNTCPSQGSRTIRTEEAILISLSVLRTKLRM